MAKRILVCSDHFYPAKGGGDLSMRLLCREISAKGYDVSVCYIGSEMDPEFRSHPLDFATLARGLWPRSWRIRGPWKRHLRNVISKENPDAVLAQQTVISPTVEVCADASIPVITFLHNVDLFCLGSFWNGEPWRCRYRCIGCKDTGPRLIQFPFFRLELPRSRRSLTRSSAVVSNSEFTRRTLADLWGIESTVLVPGMEVPSESLPVTERGKILFFSPLDYKGVEVAVGVAKAMADERFLFIGNAKDATVKVLRQLANVEYVPWTDDLSKCYAGAKLLLVPSKIPEGYGMVCVEAMSRGVPCVARGVGALPETVGEGGDIVPRRGGVADWVRVVSMYSEPAYLREKSKKAVIQGRSQLALHDPGKMIREIERAVASRKISEPESSR